MSQTAYAAAADFLSKTPAPEGKRVILHGYEPKMVDITGQTKDIMWKEMSNAKGNEYGLVKCHLCTVAVMVNISDVTDPLSPVTLGEIVIQVWIPYIPPRWSGIYYVLESSTYPSSN